jgi:predicted nucleic-acid-binding protein
MTLPVALDTNLLVRLLTGDDPEQARRVAELIDASPACFVPITVVLELEWVLRGAYRLERGAVIAALEGLMAIRQVHLEQEDLVRQAHRESPQGLAVSLWHTASLHPRSGRSAQVAERSRHRHHPLSRPRPLHRFGVGGSHLNP